MAPISAGESVTQLYLTYQPWYRRLGNRIKVILLKSSNNVFDPGQTVTPPTEETSHMTESGKEEYPMSGEKRTPPSLIVVDVELWPPPKLNGFAMCSFNCIFLVYTQPHTHTQVSVMVLTDYDVYVGMIFRFYYWSVACGLLVEKMKSVMVFMSVLSLIYLLLNLYHADYYIYIQQEKFALLFYSFFTSSSWDLCYVVIISLNLVWCVTCDFYY